MTARSQIWCSTSELTFADDFRSEPMFGTAETKLVRVTRPPLDGRHQRFVKMREWKVEKVRGLLTSEFFNFPSRAMKVSSRKLLRHISTRFENKACFS